MGLKIENLDKISGLFYEYPDKSFTIRDIAKITKMPKSTVHKYVRYLRKARLITEKNMSNDESLLFKTKKINYYLEKIVESGLIEYLIQELQPSCIILFGSFRKGESTKESDIDIFIESHIKKEPSLDEYEKILRHRIQLFTETNINNVQPRLLNNIINGIKLYGSFQIK